MLVRLYLSYNSPIQFTLQGACVDIRILELLQFDTSIEVPHTSLRDSKKRRTLLYNMTNNLQGKQII